MQLKDASILIVDDEPLLLKLISRRLDGVAGRIFVANDGVQALQVIAGNKVDLIITDVRMPVMDGVRLLKEVNASLGYMVHIILITGFADIDAREAYDLGADAFLEKPFALDDLIDAAKRSLVEREKLWQTPLDLAGHPTLAASFAGLTQACQEQRIAFGRGGFCVETTQSMVEGPVNIKLDFRAEQYVLSGQGIVRWVAPERNRVGVELTYVAKESRERVRQLTERSASFIPSATRTLSLHG
jgi:CheY-like chemotaxis protein